MDILYWFKIDIYFLIVWNNYFVFFIYIIFILYLYLIMKYKIYDKWDRKKEFKKYIYFLNYFMLNINK